MITKFDEPFCGADGFFISYLEKSIPIQNLIYWKTEYVGYDVVWEYEGIILS